MEIRTLKYFMAIADAGSITNAAEILHITQPTLSMQMKELEDELGRKLFIRASKGTKRLELTDEGLILRKRAAEILDMIKKTEDEISSEGGTVKGNVYIGSGEGESLSYVMKAMKEISRRHPAVKFHIYSGNAEDIEYRLGRGLLDFGVILGRLAPQGYTAIQLPAQETWGVLMRSDSPLAGHSSITPRDLMALPLIISSQSEFSKKLIGWAGTAYERYTIADTYNLLYNASLMVREGLGYAIGYGSVINTANTDLAFRPLQPEMNDSMILIWKDKPLTKAAKIFLDSIRGKVPMS